MRLHSPPFERRARRAVREAVRASPALKSEFQRVHKWGSRNWPPLLLRPMLSVGLGVMVWSMCLTTRNAMSSMALISLWGFYFVFLHAKGVRSTLYASRDLPALILLPVAEGDVFRWEFQAFLRKTLWLLFDFAAALLAVAAFLDWPMGKWLVVIPFAILAWMEIVAIALLGAAFFPRVPYELISGMLTVLVFGSIMAENWVGGPLLSFLDRHASEIVVLLPTGWPMAVFGLLFPDHRYRLLSLLLPIGTLLWTVPSSIARLRAEYRYVESEQPSLADPMTDQEGEDGTEERKAVTPGPTEIEDLVLSRQFFRAPELRKKGWLEGLLWGALSSRQRTLTEFVFPDGIELTPRWLRLFRNLVVVVALTLVLGALNPVLQEWTLGVGMFVTFCQALALIWPAGRAFQTLSYGSVQIPLSACYPVGFRELSLLLCKCSWVQAPLFLLYAVACGLLIGVVQGFPAAAAMNLGFKVGGLLLAARWISIPLQFSSATNDTSRIRLRTIVPIGALLGLGLGFLALGAGSLFVPETWVAWLLWFLALVDSYVFFWLYEWFYHTRSFDLIGTA